MQYTAYPAKKTIHTETDLTPYLDKTCKYMTIDGISGIIMAVSTEGDQIILVMISNSVLITFIGQLKT